MYRISRWAGVVSFGTALLAAGCGERREQESSTSTSSHAVYGGQTRQVFGAAAPYGGIGIVLVNYRNCRQVCSRPGVDLRQCSVAGGEIITQCRNLTTQCSGTLVQRDKVLTAAHCVCDEADGIGNDITSITFEPNGAAVDTQIPVSLPPDYTTDDCGGSWEDDASQDMAILTLSRDVTLAEAAAPLPTPYTGGDFIDQADAGLWGINTEVAGFGGVEADTDFGRPLVVGGLVEWGWDDDNWQFPAVNSAWWLWAPERNGANANAAATSGGDSGGALLMRRRDDPRLYIVGVIKGNSDPPGADNNKMLFSPTFDNGDGNGTWIAQRLDDADGDSIPDSRDNCAPRNREVCRTHPDRCYNPDQADGDVDGVGDSCDNCRTMRNPGQERLLDDDPIGDACDLCPHTAVGLRDDDQADADGDGVGDQCDNCEKPNRYAPCVSDADCGPGGVCRNRPGDACSRQLDDFDGDGIGGACDGCPLLKNATHQANTNEFRRAPRERSGHSGGGALRPVRSDSGLFGAGHRAHRIDSRSERLEADGRHAESAKHDRVRRDGRDRQG